MDFGGSSTQSGSSDLSAEIEAQYDPNEARKFEIQNAKRLFRREVRARLRQAERQQDTRGQARSQRRTGQDGRLPPVESIPLVDRFGVLANAMGDVRTYADHVRKQEASRSSRPPVPRPPQGNPLSPVPGLDRVLTLERPSTSRRR